MSWEAISAIGQIVGAVAVVVTLLQVARQTSVNTKAILAQTAREVDLYVGNLHLEIARDPELKRIGLKSLQSTMPAYSPAEWYEFRLFAISLMLAFQAQYIHGKLGVGVADQAQLYVRLANGMISTFPAWRRYWEEEQRGRTLTQGFFDAVNQTSQPSSFDHIVQNPSDARESTAP